jgi:hypothetical protein
MKKTITAVTVSLVAVLMTSPLASAGVTIQTNQHYRCYSVKGGKLPAPITGVTLQDSVVGTTTAATVVKPFFYCAAAAKTHGNVYPILDPTLNFVCYLIKEAKEDLPEVSTVDQFQSDDLDLTKAKLLCVPPGTAIPG